ncbi:MAG: hypothetical protein R3D58_12950 [Saprospiraceae bacterium]|nr:hypothetical protein [Lewinellaceae bacterium]
MKEFHYLHVWGITGFDQKTQYEAGELVNKEDVGLEIDFWPSDDLFYFPPLFFCTERLRAKLLNKGFQKLAFHKVSRIEKGGNFKSNFPDVELPPYYWEIRFDGIVGTDDFALWENTFLVVSDTALNFLRDNHVTHAESDLITSEFDQYFNSSKKFFWMNAKVRDYFIKMEQAKKYP